MMTLYTKVNTSEPDETYALEGIKESSDLKKRINGTPGSTTNGDTHKDSHTNNHDPTETTKDLGSTASHHEKLPYPKSVFFIVSNEFCERFSYYGMRTILSLYLVNILLYTESDAKVIFHTFVAVTYFFPLLGAILSDSFLGKFKTIFYLSIIYAIGNIVLALAAAEPIGLPQRPFSMIGLVLIALGTGGIKPCVAAFGGDQFILPQQELQLAAFFSMFYFSINAGSLISTFITPIIREDVKCFDKDTCFPLAFAIPGILMIVSIVVFVAGRSLYTVRKPEGNIVVKFCKCIGNAIKEKHRSPKKLDHWLDYAEDKYGKTLVNDVKTTLKVLVLFIPLPIFWALYDQQGSGWTFQANRMDGDIGFYTILPDQMQVVNPLLILLFIPIFTYWVYPLFAKCNVLKSPLQRMVCGGILAAVAFVISAGVSMALEDTYPVLPSEGNSQIRIYNTLNCDVQIEAPLVFEGKTLNLKAFGFEKYDVQLKDNKTYEYEIKAKDCGINKGLSGLFELGEKMGFGYYLTQDGFIGFEDNIDKGDDGFPKIRTLVDKAGGVSNIEYMDGDHVELKLSSSNNTLIKIAPGTYKIKGSDQKLVFSLGGVYTVLVNKEPTLKVQLHVVTTPNSIHILWLLPQYIVITAAEIMFSITGLEFSYSQAPVSMKSVLQSVWLLTTAIGNLIIVIIESAKIFEKQSLDFFLYAGLMVLDMFLFAYLAYRYKYIEKDELISEDEELDTTNSKDKEALNAIDNPTYKETEAP